MSAQEWIKIAAIRMEDGEVYTAQTHHLCIQRANQDRDTSHVGRHDQGFVTDTGRYVDREEAARIAIAAGQIKHLLHHPRQLFSEELMYTPPHMVGDRVVSVISPQDITK